ncbi:uncharacterized protein LOC126366124 [Pectinophora gossypiella]|uniref:uncharacterized protein LOC126366124 n=1 Tax=Pectinophora gossypiella TaxID=13191 RepID=UPI00214E5038|nr:uncharacterized protein LOC126366124 [Pectinophora gossypiella]
MIQVESFKRPSPSPSRSSVRSEGRAGRQPRVITVNRDASTMVEGEASAGPACADQDWDCLAAHAPHAPHAPHAAHFRSRTFSDGFIRNTSLELLLGVDCEACLALAAQRQCIDKHISEQEFDLVCNCNVQQNNYLNCHRDIGDHRGHTLNIYDLERIKRDAGRSHLAIGSHRSLDRKSNKSKTIGVSNYISKQLISYDPTNTLMQKIKRKLSNLKKMGGEVMSKKHQNAVQLAEITSGSSSSLKKLSMLSLADKSQRRVNSQSCIYSSTGYPKDDSKHASTYANFSGNVDQCFDRLRDCNISSDMNRRSTHKMIKMRSFDNNDDVASRNCSLDSMKFSTLDNRSRCRSIRRQMSYNDFPSERFRDNRISETWAREDTLESRSTHTDLVDDEAETFADADVIMLGTPRAARAHCTCDPARATRIPSIFFDTQEKKRGPPAPDVTERAQNPRVACSQCKAPQWVPTGTTSTTSHSSTTTGNSSRFSVWHRRWCCVAVLVLVAGTACVAGPLALRAPPGAPLHERLRLAERLLHDTPLVDGHNDLPWNIRKFLHNRIKDFRFDEDLRTISPWATSSWSHTDLPRLKQGRVAAQFWAAYVPCDAQHRDAVQLTFEQIDLIQRLTDKYQPQLTLCTSADDIISAHANHRVCSLVGVEGGHAIGGSLGVLRTLYQVGVRYLTLTSTCDTPWAECASADRPEPAPRGLTPFGKVVIKEMNRLGMLVDLSHVSERTMRDALAVSRAPVVFSHSSARALCNVTRNVPDTVLRLLAANKGLIMVNFYTSFLTCKETATVQDAIAHINHIRDIAGVDSVGLGAGYDGINYTPQGLEDVSSYPLLFAELMEEGWSIEELKKLAGLNLLRVLNAAEKVAKELASAHVAPYEDMPPRSLDVHNCSSQDL